MTDEELRDRAVARLKQTTTGYQSFVKKGVEPPPSSHWGAALADLELIGLSDPPAPPPPSGLPPRSTNVIRRFTRVDSAGFTNCRQKYQPAGSYWSPPERTDGTPWAGGIVGQVNIDTPHGEGIRYTCLDAMRTAWNPTGSRMSACELQNPAFGWERGTVQQWDGWFQLPLSGNGGGFASSMYEGSNILQIGGTTGGGPDTNGHKAWIGQDGKFTFAIRHDDSQWADRLFSSPSPMALSTWHHVRWETLITESSNGFHRGWLNGVKLLDYVGPTIWPGENIWEVMFGWYSGIGRDNVIEFSEWQVARL